MKIIRYKLFHDSESFEAWQAATSSTVCGVTPMLAGMDLTALDKTEASGTSKICVFVTYYVGTE
jgi:hypothetical protein